MREELFSHAERDTEWLGGPRLNHDNTHSNDRTEDDEGGRYCETRSTACVPELMSGVIALPTKPEQMAHGSA